MKKMERGQANAAGEAAGARAALTAALRNVNDTVHDAADATAMTRMSVNAEKVRMLDSLLCRD